MMLTVSSLVPSYVSIILILDSIFTFGFIILCFSSTDLSLAELSPKLGEAGLAWLAATRNSSTVVIFMNIVVNCCPDLH
jgi:hypothetical protein